MRNALRMLSVSLRDAIEAGKLKENPCVGIRVPKRPRTDETWHFLTIEEIDRVLRDPILTSSPHDKRGTRAALTTAIYSGLRQGELWGLRWEDVHLSGSDPYFVVRYSYAGPTKGGKPRTVPLFPPVVAALTAWRSASGVTKARGLVWPAIPLRDVKEPTERHHGTGYDAAWPTIRDAASVRREVRFHDLRHTCGSHLISGTWGRAWSLREVQAILGHASQTTTERYAHLAPDAMTGTARAARTQWTDRPRTTEQPLATITPLKEAKS